MNSAEVVKLILANGWRLVRITGSHHHFRHAFKAGLVTTPIPGRICRPARRTASRNRQG
jgi:predicted RNA binding protein YcfA (HicA-like mRNA interferase family)